MSKKVLVEENLINPDDEMKVDGVNDYTDKSSRVDNLLAKKKKRECPERIRGERTNGKRQRKGKRKRQRQRKTEERCARYPGRERPMERQRMGPEGPMAKQRKRERQRQREEERWQDGLQRLGQEQHERGRKLQRTRHQRRKERRQVWKADKRKEERRKRESLWQVKKFAELTADFDEVDVAWILNFERLQQQVYMYSDDDRSVYYPNDLDWPIVWALPRYNKQTYYMY